MSPRYNPSVILLMEWILDIPDVGSDATEKVSLSRRSFNCVPVNTWVVVVGLKVP